MSNLGHGLFELVEANGSVFGRVGFFEDFVDDPIDVRQRQVSVRIAHDPIYHPPNVVMPEDSVIIKIVDPKRVHRFNFHRRSIRKDVVQIDEVVERHLIVVGRAKDFAETVGERVDVQFGYRGLETFERDVSALVFDDAMIDVAEFLVNVEDFAAFKYISSSYSFSSSRVNGL